MPIIFLCFISILFFPMAAHAADVSYWSELVSFIHTQQQAFHRELAATIRQIQEGGIKAAWAMISISFLYGVFHAAGPGHGKAGISTYLLSHESQLKRGLFLSFSAAFVQGLSAVLLVEGMVGIVGWSRQEVKGMVPLLEMASFGLIGLIGLILMKRALTSFYKRMKARQNTASLNFDHDHDEKGNQECSSCGHSHAPSIEELSVKTSLKDTLAIIFSVGIRPCSGSVLVLIFAEIIGLRWAGITSVFMISFGTALTVSSFAILAIYFRKIALSIVNYKNDSILHNFVSLITFCGGLLIALIAFSLFLKAQDYGHPLF